MSSDAGSKGRWQAYLLDGYGALAERGLLDNRLVRSAFDAAYHVYKLGFETGAVGCLRPFVTPGTMVIDVGANIGFFTNRFAHWVGPAGAVVALEPEAVNLARLRRRVARHRWGKRVECIGAVAAASDGHAYLEVNPRHPGDHKIAEHGVEVVARSVDSLVSERPARRVSLVKIDVQGAEVLVLGGMRATIAEHRPALFVELHQAGLALFGSSVGELVQTIVGYGYAGRCLARRRLEAVATPAELVSRHADHYGDVLFLPVERA